MTTPSRPLRRPARSGYVLVVVLLLMLALTALAHAALVTSRTHRRAGGLVGQARARQWSAVSLAVDAARGLDSLDAPAAELDLPGARGRSEVVRLSPEVGLIRARVDSLGHGSEAGALVWALDPAMRVAALPRAFESGSWPDAQTVAAIGTGEALVCPPDALPDPWRALVRTVDASAPELGDPLALGHLPRAELMAGLTPLGQTAGTPAPPTAGGACTADPWNWGALSPLDHPCRDTWVGVGRVGDLRLEGGEGQGVLAVTGRLELAGARFRGLLLVGGDLVLDGGATVEGVARAGGAVTILDGSWTAGPCAAWRALGAAEAIRTPRMLARPGWILH